jgi:hypothetical protein
VVPAPRRRRRSLRPPGRARDPRRARRRRTAPPGPRDRHVHPAGAGRGRPAPGHHAARDGRGEPRDPVDRSRGPRRARGPDRALVRPRRGHRTRRRPSRRGPAVRRAGAGAAGTADHPLPPALRGGGLHRPRPAGLSRRRPAVRRAARRRLRHALARRRARADGHGRDGGDRGADEVRRRPDERERGRCRRAGAAARVPRPGRARRGPPRGAAGHDRPDRLPCEDRARGRGAVRGAGRGSGGAASGGAGRGARHRRLDPGPPRAARRHRRGRLSVRRRGAAPHPRGARPVGRRRADRLLAPVPRLCGDEVGVFRKGRWCRRRAPFRPRAVLVHRAQEPCS